MGSLREYETVFVLHPRLEESQVEEEIDAVQKTIEAGEGSVVDIERWGKRKLAYEVRKVNEGIYTLVRFRSGVNVLQDLDRRYRLREDVIRHLTVAAQALPPEKPSRRDPSEGELSTPEPTDVEKEPQGPKAVEGESASVETGAGESTATTSTPEAEEERPAETES